MREFFLLFICSFLITWFRLGVHFQFQIPHPQNPHPPLLAIYTWTHRPNHGSVFGICIWPIILWVSALEFIDPWLISLHATLKVFLTNMTTIFVGVYHQSVGIAGLHYLALGFGQACSAQMNARFLDRIYIYFKNKNGGVGQPEFRLREYQLYSPFPSSSSVSTISLYPLPLLSLGLCARCNATFFYAWLLTREPGEDCLASMIPGTFFLPIGLLITGWAVQYKVHWIVADIVGPVSLSQTKNIKLLSFGPVGDISRRSGYQFEFPVGTVIRRWYVYSACCFWWAAVAFVASPHWFMWIYNIALAVVACMRALAGTPFVEITSRDKKLKVFHFNRIWISSVRTTYVQCIRIRKGRYNTRLCRNCRWLPCVSIPIFPFKILPLLRVANTTSGRPWLFWRYGKRIRMASKYANQVN